MGIDPAPPPPGRPDMRFRQQDKRPKEEFNVGDLVNFHPSMTNELPMFAGVVIQVDEDVCHVIFATEEIALRIATAEAGQQLQKSEAQTEGGMMYRMKKHNLVRTTIGEEQARRSNVYEWLQLPSLEEIDKIRYEYLSGGLFDDNDILGS